jgi:amino acid adenylation domain-containing protein/non-ribosomal peptide synthase protein (TIGR01720 family)
VAVCAGRSAGLSAALLGVLAAGGAYLPVDPEESPSRIAFMLADAGAAALVTDSALAARLPADLPRVLLDAPLPPAPLPDSGVEPASLAYVIYTSGSTGAPKGVGVSHAALAEHVRTWARVHEVGPGDRFLQLNSASFDPAVEQCCTALASGATLVMRGPEMWDGEELTAQIAALELTVVDLPTSVWSRWVAGGAAAVPPTARRVILGGEELRAGHAREWHRQGLSGVPLLNGYGPTEAVVTATQHQVEPDDGESGRVPIGRPLPGRVARVLGRWGEEMPVGVPGELCLGGPLARGYLGRPAPTAERFVPDPFGGPGERLYCSGDLVRRRPDGALEFLGRVDDQVKVRGVRVEPGEVAAALLAHPAVREVEVVARQDGGDMRLVAYLVPASDPAPAEGELRAFLRGRLPEAMVPAAFVPLAALPLTPHGKVDRRALPAPAAPAGRAGSAPPRDAREELLATIWREVLGLERLGVHDNFFQLGGDSILGIQVVARARRAGFLVTARQLFEHQTIAGLAAAAESAGPEAGEEQGQVEGEVPLTPIQRRFFAEARRRPWQLNQAVLLVPRQRLAAAPLAAALDRLAAHHDALRLRFPREGDGWRQVHAPAATVPLLEVDLTAVPPGAALAAAEQLQAGLDLARGPLFTAALLRTGEGDRLLLTIHHLVVDGVSWRALLEDLAAALAGRALPPKTTSWKRWAERLAGFARSPELAGELPFWLASAAPGPPLPRDLPESGALPRQETVAVALGREETRALLQEVPEVYRTQVNDLLLAALARAFAAWTGQSALRVDLEGHGREEIFPGVDLSRTMGWFTTTFPVLLALPPGGGPREAIRAVKESLRAIPGRGLGYGLLRYLSDPETAAPLAALPEPEVSFNYLGRFDATLEAGGPFAFATETVRGTTGEAPAGRPSFAIDALVVDDRLRVSWTYDPGRHLPATAERLARGFLDEIAALIAHCQSPEAGGFTPSDFPLAGLDQEALDRLLGRDPGVEDLYPLTPMQEGLLFHSLLAGTGADPYFEQLTAEVEGDLDEAAFAAAWQRVVERHTALRTGFLRDGLERPLQLVRRAVEIPWTHEDWRGLPPAEREARWRGLLAADRARGFDLARPPLLRLALARTGEETRRLVWSSHHILLDGWCIPLLLNEVFTLYGAAVAGRAAALPPARPYRDYIAWLDRRDPAEAERYWRRRLAGFAAPTPVPFDRSAGSRAPRPEDYCEREIILPATRMEALAQRLRVTLNTLVQGAWALTLARYAQASDVVFGAVVSGRPAELPGVESMVGLFINTVPVRVEIPAGGPASAWLARLQEEQIEQRPHDWTPLTEIQQRVDLPAGEPLLSSLLVFESYPFDATLGDRLEGLRIREVALAERTNYPLTLTVVARGGLALRLIADPRFEPATVRRLLAHLETLLEGLAADPESRPAGRPLLSPAERHQLTVEWNDTARPSRATIPSLFAAQAARTPDAVAVVCGEEEITYAELDRRARRVAGRLLRLGVVPESRVAVPAERSMGLIPTLLGILQAGCAYLPADPELPEERRRFLLEDAGAISLDLEEGEEPPELPALSPDQLAYVIYTSGSTGQPKGVAVTHGNVVRLVRGARWAAMGPAETFLQLGSLAFDASTLEIWAPLLNGGRLVLFPGRRPGLDEITRAIALYGVTSLWLTAGLFHQMVGERLEGLAPLRQLLAGGDVLSPAHVRRALEGLPGCTVVNGYGPTENTTFTTCFPIRDAAGWDATVPIGRPIQGTTVHLLDGDLRPVPMGVWGELYTGGAGVARGYLARPALTAERFVPDSWGEGARLYRTGDVARRRPDGVLEFLGRRDGQVKIRGFRVELGEVEAALAGHPRVRAAVVVPWETAGDRRLAAYVVGDVEEPELRRHLAARLPEPMVPAVFVPLDRLPLTPNGKVDRRALPAPDPAAGRAREYLPPSNPMEESLAAACAELLGVERVGMRDSFFALGGHSLLATRLVSRLTQTHGLPVTLRMVFDAADLGDLAGRIVEAERAAAPRRIPRRPPGSDSLPASFAQERLWLIDRLQPGLAAYNIPLALRIAGDVRPAVLSAALGEIVRRHEALRTTFREADGRPVQEIAPPGRWELPRVDLAALPAGVREALARRLAQEEAERPFDLRRGPLLRATLLRLAPAEHVLLLDMHHVVSDGWSLGVIVREITQLYGAALAGAPSPLPELEIQYADFAVWQRGWLQGEELERQLAYWRERLAGLPPALDLPADRPVPARRTHGGARFQMALDRDLARGVAALARRCEATPFAVLLAAFQALLARLTGASDLAVGSPIANRNRLEVEPLIGFFVNTLVLRAELADDPPFRDLLARARRATLEAYAHQDLPFDRLVEELRPERRLAVSPLFQVLFALQNAPMGAMELPGLTLSPLPFETRTAQFDLEVSVWEREERMILDVVYSAERLDPATPRRWMASLETLLRGLIADPGRRISEAPLLSAAERHQLLVEWNPGPVPEERGRLCLHRRFEAQVDRAPEAVALSAVGEHLTYRDLDAWANRIARHLRASGVLPGDRVALRLERSAGMVAALLGVLKAGAAYVPIDPTYPEERAAFIREDSGAAFLLQAKDLEGIDRYGAERPETPADPDLPAYVIYTSGSTGRPKGVIVTHANVDRLFTATDPWFDFGPGDVWTLFHSYAFDFSVWEIWGALLHGGRLVVVPYWVSRSPEAFHELLREERVTVLSQTPSAFRQLIWAAEGKPADLPLRWVVFGGEALEPASFAPWIARYGDRPRLINMYGITETTVHVTWRPVGERDLAAGSRIGRPIPDLAVYLLDPHLQPVPLGTPGEIHVGGAGLALGYLGRPDLTAERFVPDPFSGRPGARLYRSGDLARRLPDGDLEYLGRADQQVKIRGFRVEPGEIEAALASLPGVREVAVLARSDGTDRSVRLVAYVVGEAADPAALREALGLRLPDYMIPAAFVFLDALPLTGNGKVDRRTLPAPEAAAAAGQPPRDPLERFLAAQIRDVLGLPADREIGIDESFFDLGGTSITSAIFTHRLQEALGGTVQMVTLFDHPTVASLAGYVRERHPGASWEESGTAVRPRMLERDVLVPLQAGSPGRRPFFLVHSVGGEVVAYRELARRLGPDQPVWGLQTPDPPLETVEEMAARFLADVRAVQPAGPYRIAGWSMGAAVAYEMARQLEAQGEAADVVALIDAVSPRWIAGEAELRDVEMLGLFALALADLHDVQIEGLELPPELRLATLGLSQVDLSGLDLDAALEITLDLGRQAGLLPPSLDAAELRRLFERFRANRAALSRYQPLPYGGELHLFRAVDQVLDDLDPTLGWNDLAPGRVRIFDSPGDHYTILREEVEALAERLRGLLEE